jgi:hypothetical protein
MFNLLLKINKVSFKRKNKFLTGYYNNVTVL